MPKFVDIEPLERNFEERYLDYRNRSQRKMTTGRFRVDDELTTAAMIMESCLDSLREAPAADIAPVRHAKWEVIVGSDGKEHMVCTGCRKQQDLTGVFAYCPNCGAKMDLEG